MSKWITVLELTLSASPSVIKYYSSADVFDTAQYYEALVESWGNLTRQIPRLSGPYTVSDVTITLNNRDKEFSKLLASYSFTNATAAIKVGNETDTISTFTTIYTGIVSSLSLINGGLSASLALQDSSMARFSKTIPGKFTMDDFPELENFDIYVDRCPIIYGDCAQDATDDYSLIPCQYVGMFGGKYTFAVAQHEVTVTEITVEGTEDKSLATGMTTIVGTGPAEDGGNGLKLGWTFLQSADDDTSLTLWAALVEDHTSVLVSCDAEGYTESSAVIKNPVQALKHFLITYCGYASGDIDSTYYSTSFAAVNTLAQDIEAVICTVATYSEVIAEFCKSFSLTYFHTPEGKIAIAYNGFESGEAGPQINHFDHIVSGSFALETNKDIINQIDPDCPYNPISQSYTLLASIQNELSYANVGEYFVEELQLKFANDADTAIRIAGIRLFWSDEDRVLVSFQVPLSVMPSGMEISKPIRLTNPYGIDANGAGYVDEEFKILSMGYKLGAIPIVTIQAISIQPGLHSFNYGAAPVNVTIASLTESATDSEVTITWTIPTQTYNFTAGAGTVDTTNNTIDLGVTPPPDGYTVQLTTSDTLPTGLVTKKYYYIRAVSGTKCKLATENNDAYTVDITGVGSGSCAIVVLIPQYLQVYFKSSEEDVSRLRYWGGLSATDLSFSFTPNTFSLKQESAGLDVYLVPMADGVMRSLADSAYSTIASGSRQRLSVISDFAATPGAAGSYEIELSWTPITDGKLRNYWIYRNTSNTKTGATLISYALLSGTYVDSNATPGITYYYFIQALTHTAANHASDAYDSASAMVAEIGNAVYDTPPAVTDFSLTLSTVAIEGGVLKAHVAVSFTKPDAVADPDGIWKGIELWQSSIIAAGEVVAGDATFGDASGDWKQIGQIGDPSTISIDPTPAESIVAAVSYGIQNNVKVAGNVGDLSGGDLVYPRLKLDIPEIATIGKVQSFSVWAVNDFFYASWEYPTGFTSDELDSFELAYSTEKGFDANVAFMVTYARPLPANRLRAEGGDPNKTYYWAIRAKGKDGQYSAWTYFGSAGCDDNASLRTAVTTYYSTGQIINYGDRLESTNFVDGVSGMRIKADGDTQFNNITARGAIYASSGEITGTLGVTGAIICGDVTQATANVTINAAGIAGWKGDASNTDNLCFALATMSGDWTIGTAVYSIAAGDMWCRRGYIGGGSTTPQTIEIDTDGLSCNYVAGTSGFLIGVNGAIEANNITARGAIHASSGSITGTLGVTGAIIVGDVTQATANVTLNAAGLAGWKGDAANSDNLCFALATMTGDWTIGTAVYSITAGDMWARRGFIGGGSTTPQTIAITTDGLSSNFVTGVSGFKIGVDGKAEFDQVKIRVTGDIDATDHHLVYAGDMSGASYANDWYGIFMSESALVGRRKTTGTSTLNPAVFLIGADVPTPYKITVTGSSANDTLSSTSHGWTNGTAFKLRVSGGSLPSPLVADTVYWVVNAATDTFKVAATSGGSAINLTTDGSGTIEAYKGDEVHPPFSSGDFILADNVRTAIVDPGSSTYYLKVLPNSGTMEVKGIMTIIGDSFVTGSLISGTRTSYHTQSSPYGFFGWNGPDTGNGGTTNNLNFGFSNVSFGTVTVNGESIPIGPGDFFARSGYLLGVRIAGGGLVVGSLTGGHVSISKDGVCGWKGAETTGDNISFASFTTGGSFVIGGHTYTAAAGDFWARRGFIGGDSSGNAIELSPTYIRSSNFTAGSSGYCIYTNGKAEFGEVTIRSGGTLTSGTDLVYAGDKSGASYANDWYGIFMTSAALAGRRNTEGTGTLNPAVFLLGANIETTYKITVTGSAANDTLTCSGHGWTNATSFKIRATGGGSLPSPLVANTVYWVVNASTNTFKVASTSGGSAINLTSDGSGTIEAYKGDEVLPPFSGGQFFLAPNIKTAVETPTLSDCHFLFDPEAGTINAKGTFNILSNSTITGNLYCIGETWGSTGAIIAGDTNGYHTILNFGGLTGWNGDSSVLANLQFGFGTIDYGDVELGNNLLSVDEGFFFAKGGYIGPIVFDTSGIRSIAFGASAWSSGTTYKRYQYCYTTSGLNTSYWKSKQNSNLNHTPAGGVGDSWWELATKGFSITPSGAIDCYSINIRSNQGSISSTDGVLKLLLGTPTASQDDATFQVSSEDGDVYLNYKGAAATKTPYGRIYGDSYSISYDLYNKNNVQSGTYFCIDSGAYTETDIQLSNILNSTGVSVNSALITPTTVYLMDSSTVLFRADISSTCYVDVKDEYRVNGNKVVGARGSAIAHATNATNVISRCNDVIDFLRGWGSIAT